MPKKVWSSPERLAGAGAIGAVACPTTTSCVALTDNGLSYHYVSGHWSSPSQTAAATGASGGPSLSCSGPDFCMALWKGTEQTISWNGSAWSAPLTVPGAQTLESLGCGSPTFCVAVDGVGVAFYYNGSGWSEGSQDWGSVASISCVGSTFCISVEGGVSAWNGSSWTEPQVYGTSSVFVGVSCPYASFCAAVDTTGQAIDWNGSRWTGPASIAAGTSPIGGPAFAGVSCSGSSFCVAVASTGAAYVYDGRSWSQAENADPGHQLTAVACTKTVFCVATDKEGYAVVRT